MNCGASLKRSAGYDSKSTPCSETKSPLRTADTTIPRITKGESHVAQTRKPQTSRKSKKKRHQARSLPLSHEAAVAWRLVAWCMYMVANWDGTHGGWDEIYHNGKDDFEQIILVD